MASTRGRSGLAAWLPGRLGVAQRAPWRRLAPQVEEIEIASSTDGAGQRALFYDSGSARAKPLLVVLHSWSSSYLQNIHIPYARFAIENDWVFVHPDFRGPNRNADATLSELAVQDVLDAVDHAMARANVDPSRVYLLGYSSGAMMALVLAGREPERWAGVAAWVAVYDPDLVILSYGGNDLRRLIFGHVERARLEDETRAVLTRVRAAVPGAACLVLGISDHDRSGSARVRPEHVDAVLDAQRRAAARAGCAFWDTTRAMGGAGSFARWRAEALAAGDGKHLNERGRRVIAERLESALSHAGEAQSQPRAR